MRSVCTFALALTALVLVAGGAAAHHGMDLGMVQLYATSDDVVSSSEPRDVAAGEVFAVSGECIDGDDDVRVVLSLADGADARAGFHEMLATDESREDGSLRVRVPNMAEARNHVFRVKLFVGDNDPQVCDAGSIRVV